MSDAVDLAAAAGGAGGSRADLPPHLMMVRLLGGFRISRMLDTLVQLDVAEHLAKGPLSVEALARQTGSHAASLGRVLRAVAAFGIFSQDEQGRFALTADAELLRKDASGSVYSSVKVFGQSWHWNMWGGLLEAVRTGRPAFEAQHGVDFDSWSAGDPALAEAIVESKAAMFEPSDDAILDAYDFSAASHVVDVCGGSGALVARILARNPRMRGTVYDRAVALGAARRLMTARGLTERCSFVEGEGFAEPPRGDVLLLRGVLHYWGDAEATRILRACRSVMVEGDRLLVCEMPMPAGNSAFVGKFIDVESMLLTKEGRERSESEYRVLLKSAGLRVARVVETRAPISVIEGVIA